MRTLQSVNMEIDSIIAAGKKEFDPPIRRKMSKEIKRLHIMRNYLEFNPSAEKLMAALQQIKEQIKRNDSYYADWLSWNKDRSKPKSDYEKIFNKPLRDRQRMLEEILGLEGGDK